jgi:hypothetical protein
MTDELEKNKVKVEAQSPDTSANNHGLGFMAGQMTIPNDFDTMGGAEIEQLFYDEGKRSQ